MTFCDTKKGQLGFSESLQCVVKALLSPQGGGYLISGPKGGGLNREGAGGGAYLKSYSFDKIHNNFPNFTITC